TSEQTDFLARARTSSERLGLVVDDLLFILHSDSGHFALHRDETDLDALIHEVVEELELLAANAGVHLRANVPANLPPAHLDAQRITQVVRNLATNAIKFTPANGEVTISASSPGDQVVICVRDTGTGIAPEYQEHISDHFFKVGGAAATGHYQGHGLGLAIVKIIVEAQGGSVHVESTPGEGSTFTAFLPQHAQLRKGRRPKMPSRARNPAEP